MYGADQNGYTTSVSSGHFNSSLSNYMTGFDYSSFPYSGTPSTLFTTYEPTLIDIAALADSIFVNGDEDDVDSLIVHAMTAFSSNGRAATMNIVHTMITTNWDDADMSDVTTYLLNVQSVANASTVLTSTDKGGISLMVAIINASYYYWGTNLPQI